MGKGNWIGDEAIWVYNFSRNLRYIMRERKISYRNLSRKTGLTPAIIGTYISASVKPTPERFDAIVKALGCEPDDLTSNYNAWPSD